MVRPQTPSPSLNLTSNRSQLQAKPIQPPRVNLLRALRHLRSPHRHHRQEVWPSTRPPDSNVYFWIHDFACCLHAEFRRHVCAAVLSWHGGVGILSVGDLLFDYVLSKR